MATEVTIPQLGESVTEGTVTAWLVEVGDTVETDQPLFELSSDKIDTEVPSPAGGVLTEILVQVDETVDVGTVVAIIGEQSEGEGGGEQAAPEADEGDDTAEPDDAAEEQEEDTAQAPQGEAAGSTQQREEVAAEEGAEEAAEATDGEDEPTGEASGNGRGAEPVSPIVRRMAAEYDLDLSTLSGSGEGGRVTREDVEAAIADRGDAKEPKDEEPQPQETEDKPKTEDKPAAAKETKPAAAEKVPAAATAKPSATPQPQRTTSMRPGEREHVEDLSRIRQRIAAKMMESLSSSAQLTTVQEADMTLIMRLRERAKEDFKAREGVSLSPFVFLCRAAVMAVRRHPRINAVADWQAGKVTFHDYVNLGIAVDTEKGLLVPNVKNADDLTLPALGRAIAEVAGKARGTAKSKLEMQDIEGGTFTVTNTGSVGVLIDTPILNYPEVAILGTGAVKKRPVVVEDEGGASIAIRDMVYFSLTYDHRLIDGADAARFVTDVAEVVETHDWEGELGY